MFATCSLFPPATWGPLAFLPVTFSLLGMWNFPRPGTEPVSPALAGRFFTTQPPENAHLPLDTVNVSCMQMGRWKCD